MKGKKKLSLEELEQIKGGYIVKRGFFNNYWIVDDKTGEKLWDCFWKADAKYAAECYGVSKKVISKKEYKKMFNK